MKKIIIFIYFFCQSCYMDFSSGAEILNNSNERVYINIKYDKLVVDSFKKSSNSSRESNFSFLERKAMNREISYTIDTISFSISYILKQNQTLPFTHNPGFKPNLSMIKTIEIKSKSKTIVLNRANFSSDFVETEKGLWVYTIK